jgi:hypothetical protein
VGEGHDKGGVESRGKAIRLQHLTPVLRGESLAAVSQALLRDLEQAFGTRRNHDGQRAVGRGTSAAFAIAGDTLRGEPDDAGGSQLASVGEGGRRQLFDADVGSRRDPGP